MDLRLESDQRRMRDFLGDVAEGEVSFDERATVAGRDVWHFSWHDATSPAGAELRVLAEASHDGEIRFTVLAQRGGVDRVSVTATVHPYQLAWQSSVAYARNLIELAKVRALER